MSMDQLSLSGIILAALIVLAGMVVCRAGGRPYLLFLLAVNAALLLTTFVAVWLVAPPGNELGSTTTSLLAPVNLGVLALIMIRSKDYLALRHNEKLLALALGLASVALLIGVAGQQYLQADYEYGVLVGAVMLATVWTLASKLPPFAVGFAAVALILLGACNATASGALTPIQVPPPPAWLSFPLQLILFFALPGVVPVTAAVLVASALKPRTPSGGVGAVSWWPAIWRLSLAVVLLGYLIYTLVWGAIWDQTVDFGWGGILAQLAGLVVVPAGMVMAATAFGWRRLAGLAFAILVPLAIVGATTYGGSIPHHALTESRAASIQAAVERYHSRTGSYPAELPQLIPTEVWWIPEPVILSGQGWCYQGGKDFYRLGAIFQEFWGRPLSIRIYASAGSAPETSWECDKRLEELKPRYEPQSAPETPDAAPTLEPPPASAAAVQRPLMPFLVRAPSSPTGDFLLPDYRYGAAVARTDCSRARAKMTAEDGGISP